LKNGWSYHEAKQPRPLEELNRKRDKEMQNSEKQDIVTLNFSVEIRGYAPLG
jgi:hypothetical protein